MFELVRTYLGYCFECRMPKFVGEFKLPGWQHVFQICDSCLQRRVDEMHKHMAMQTPSTPLQYSHPKDADLILTNWNGDLEAKQK